MWKKYIMLCYEKTGHYDKIQEKRGQHFQLKKISHVFDPFLTGSYAIYGWCLSNQKEEGLINIIVKMVIVQDTWNCQSVSLIFGFDLMNFNFIHTTNLMNLCKDFQLIFWSFIVFLEGFTEMGIKILRSPLLDPPKIGQKYYKLEHPEFWHISYHIYNYETTFNHFHFSYIICDMFILFENAYSIQNNFGMFHYGNEGWHYFGIFHKFLNMWFFHVFDKEIIIFNIFLLFLYFCHAFSCLCLL